MCGNRRLHNSIFKGRRYPGRNVCMVYGTRTLQLFEKWKFIGSVISGDGTAKRFRDESSGIHQERFGRLQYTKQVFKAHPLELLIKPVTEEQIISVLDFSFKVINRYKRKFEFQVGTDYYFIPYDDIMYFYSEKRKIRIITKDGEESFYGKLSDICKKLPKNFIVIHKSYIVNMDYIKRYAYEVLELVNGTILSISKANRKMVRKALLAK